MEGGAKRTKRSEQLVAPQRSLQQIVGEPVPSKSLRSFRLNLTHDRDEAVVWSWLPACPIRPKSKCVKLQSAP